MNRYEAILKAISYISDSISECKNTEGLDGLINNLDRLVETLINEKTENVN